MPAPPVQSTVPLFAFAGSEQCASLSRMLVVTPSRRDSQGVVNLPPRLAPDVFCVVHSSGAAVGRLISKRLENSMDNQCCRTGPFITMSTVQSLQHTKFLKE
ncbi:hypothetical protein AB1Y20_020448 [Prymnesium parvum]|uniref:Cleavage and polyadenylation specificity factor 100 kDa subunit n=1 Tax=Prymnesium parvum TaxID=97485 RepID=A0AB34JZC4_PRYPA